MQKRMEKERAEKEREREMNEYMQVFMVASTEKPMRPGSCNPCRSCLRCFFKQEPPQSTDAPGGPQEQGGNKSGGDTQPSDERGADAEESSTDTETEPAQGLLPSMTPK